jgi:ribosomal protein L44E
MKLTVLLPMKYPKKTNRFCPSCRKKTEHKIKLLATGVKRGSMKRGGKKRVKLRGLWRGLGNLGRYSKPAIKSWKRKTKNTKRNVFVYTCSECKKSHQSKKGKRASKVVFE